MRALRLVVRASVGPDISHEPILTTFKTHTPGPTRPGDRKSGPRARSAAAGASFVISLVLGQK